MAHPGVTDKDIRAFAVKVIKMRRADIRRYKKEIAFARPSSVQYYAWWEGVTASEGEIVGIQRMLSFMSVENEDRGRQLPGRYNY